MHTNKALSSLKKDIKYKKGMVFLWSMSKIAEQLDSIVDAVSAEWPALSRGALEGLRKELYTLYGVMFRDDSQFHEHFFGIFKEVSKKKGIPYDEEEIRSALQQERRFFPDNQIFLGFTCGMTLQQLEDVLQSFREGVQYPSLAVQPAFLERPQGVFPNPARFSQDAQPTEQGRYRQSCVVHGSTVSVRQSLEALLHPERGDVPTVQKALAGRLACQEENLPAHDTSLAVVYTNDGFILSPSFFKENKLLLRKGPLTKTGALVYNGPAPEGLRFVCYDYFGTEYAVVEKDIPQVLKQRGFFTRAVDRIIFRKNPQYQKWAERLYDLQEEIAPYALYDNDGSITQHTFAPKQLRKKQATALDPQGYLWMTELDDPLGLKYEEALRSKLVLAMIDPSYNFSKPSSATEKNQSGFSNRDTTLLLEAYLNNLKERREEQNSEFYGIELKIGVGDVDCVRHLELDSIKDYLRSGGFHAKDTRIDQPAVYLGVHYNNEPKQKEIEMLVREYITSHLSSNSSLLRNIYQRVRIIVEQSCSETPPNVLKFRKRS